MGAAGATRRRAYSRRCRPACRYGLWTAPTRMNTFPVVQALDG